MNQKIHVTAGGHTRLQAKAGIAVAVGFLVFGLVFGGVVAQESSGGEAGMSLLLILFMILWVGVCVAMIVSYARILSGGAPADSSLVDLHVEAPSRLGGEEPAPDEEPARGADFDERLRKLEGLMRDGLLTESEFREKREQILREKW